MRGHPLLSALQGIQAGYLGTTSSLISAEGGLSVKGWRGGLWVSKCMGGHGTPILGITTQSLLVLSASTSVAFFFFLDSHGTL